MKRNKELFNRVADHLEKHPEAYDQSEWLDEDTTCGTVMCIAGWAATLDGARVDDVGRVDSGGERVHVSRYAAKCLGLDLEEALTLFDAWWIPSGGSVPDALRSFGDGAPIVGEDDRW